MNLAAHDEAVPVSNSIEDKQGERATGALTAWRRPAVTIIDVKRTMATPGL